MRVNEGNTAQSEKLAFMAGSEPKITDADVDFHTYCQIQKKKAWLLEQLKNIQEKYEKLDFYQKKTVAGISRRLRDLERSNLNCVDWTHIIMHGCNRPDV